MLHLKLILIGALSVRTGTVGPQMLHQILLPATKNLH